MKRDAFLMENPYFFIIELYILTEEVSKFSQQKKKIWNILPGWTPLQVICLFHDKEDPSQWLFHTLNILGMRHDI